MSWMKGNRSRRGGGGGSPRSRVLAPIGARRDKQRGQRHISFSKLRLSSIILQAKLHSWDSK